MNRKTMKSYFELFGTLPTMPITSNLSDKEFEERVKQCIKQEAQLEELYSDDYDEPDGVLI